MPFEVDAVICASLILPSCTPNLVVQDTGPEMRFDNQFNQLRVIAKRTLKDVKDL